MITEEHSMSKVTLAVMQPTFLPWVGYFDLIDQSDTFIFYNDVQFVKQSWLVRNRLKGANGIFYVNCPVKKSDFGTSIDKIQIDNSKPWRKKLLKTLFYTYQKAEYFKPIHAWMVDFFNEEFDQLQDLTTSFIAGLSEKVGISTRLKRSSELGLKAQDRIDKLIELCQVNGANTYISTPGAHDYLKEEQGEMRMQKEGIDLFYHHYQPEPYPVSVSEYEAYLSIVDLLYNVGFEGALDHIRKGRRPLNSAAELENG